MVSPPRPLLEADLALHGETMVGPDVGGACEHLTMASECGLGYMVQLGDKVALLLAHHTCVY